ncbi:hypothetical protein Btru_071582 [Bulinus truncatus]|nr:hypothetical protein Btru_071582 [Bulinus truncatus]
MARRIGVLGRILGNLKNSLFTVKQNDKFVGIDKFGNKYFEKEGDNSHNLRASRYIKQNDETDWDIPEIPVEWEAWLRGKRKDPPTTEEIERNYIKMIQTKRRAEELDRKYSQKKNSVVSSTSKDIAQDIEPSQQQNPFPQYEEYEFSPGEKYNKMNNKIK